jgi:alanine racemase
VTVAEYAADIDALESVAVVDLAAVTHNVALLVEAAAGSAVMSVVKANGYGHGAVAVARAALEGGAGWLGVADVVEALELREAGIDAPVLAWLHPPQADFSAALAAGIDLGVSDLDQLGRVAEARRVADGGAVASVHLKVDTGLGRNGADESSWQALFAEARRLELTGQLRVVGIFSHLSNAADDEDARQLGRLHAAIALARQAGLRPVLRHLASTAATLRLPDTRLDLVRTGIGSYGLSPFDDDAGSPGLRPAMALHSTVVAVAPSSDADFAARSAIVPLGYGDGIPPQTAGRIHITGDAGPLLVTRIESDHLVVEPVSPSYDPVRGDRVTLFGNPQHGLTSVDAWASAAGTINYEIVTRLGSRIPRRYTT